MKNNEILIYALDADGLDDEKVWVDRLAGSVGAFKIGYQLFLREGPAAAALVRDAGSRVFLDLKLHDIPHTVREAAREATRLGAFMFTVHASGGRAMLEAAVEGAREESSRLGVAAPLVVGVTVLTSLDDASVREIGFSDRPDGLVMRLAGLCVESGLSGVVCSPLEASRIRSLCGPGFKIVCPGVRPAGSAAGDQARFSTPSGAVRAGADYLVVGRPIREAADPAGAARSIVKEALEAAT